MAPSLKNKFACAFTNYRIIYCHELVLFLKGRFETLKLVNNTPFVVQSDHRNKDFWSTSFKPLLVVARCRKNLLHSNYSRSNFYLIFFHDHIPNGNGGIIFVEMVATKPTPISLFWHCSHQKLTGDKATDFLRYPMFSRDVFAAMLKYFQQ